MSFQVGDRVVVAVDLPFPYSNYPRPGTEGVIVGPVNGDSPTIWWEVMTDKKNLTDTGGWVFMERELEPAGTETWAELELM